MSPLLQACAIGRAHRLGSRTRDSIRDSMRGSIRDSMRDSIRDSITICQNPSKLLIDPSGSRMGDHQKLSKQLNLPTGSRVMHCQTCTKRMICQAGNRHRLQRLHMLSRQVGPQRNSKGKGGSHQTPSKMALPGALAAYLGRVLPGCCCQMEPFQPAVRLYSSPLTPITSSMQSLLSLTVWTESSSACRYGCAVNRVFELYAPPLLTASHCCAVDCACLRCCADAVCHLTAAPLVSEQLQWPPWSLTRVDPSPMCILSGCM